MPNQSQASLTIHLPAELQNQVQQVAQQQDKSVSEMISWLLEQSITSYLPQAETTSVSPEKRPFGLCAGEFTVPDDFDAPLPSSIIEAFEGK